jgi:uncharacterized membrane protein YtjA (UPF0391 family)
MGVAVARIDDAAGEHPGAAGVVGAVGAAGKQDLDACIAVAHDDDGRRRPRRPFRRRLGGGAGKADASATGALIAFRRDREGFSSVTRTGGTSPYRQQRPTGPPSASRQSGPACCLSQGRGRAAKITSIAAVAFPRRRLRPTKEFNMLHYAVVFFVIALIAALFGFGGIAAGAAGIAKILFVVFVILAVAAFLFGRNRGV